MACLSLPADGVALPMLLGSAPRTPMKPMLPIQRRSPNETKTVLLGVPKRQDAGFDGSSTSIGSTLTALSEDVDDITSPVNWRIRNTFLDMLHPVPTLLQGFQKSRRSHSAPAGGREAREREEAAAQLAAEEEAAAEEVSAFQLAAEEAAAAEVEEAAYPACGSSPDSNRGALEEVVSVPLPPAAPRPLALAELVGPQPCSTGSILHYQGTCKPCAFFWKVVGCQYGSECEFCHICDADERKRRNKEKRMAMHSMQMTTRMPTTAAARHVRGGRAGGQRALERVISMP